MNNFSKKLEDIKNYFPELILLIVLFLFTFSIFNYEKNFTNYVFVENLINYQGGFVRRGLIGEIDFISKELFDSYYPILPIIIMGFLYVINFLFIIILSLKILFI